MRETKVVRHMVVRGLDDKPFATVSYSLAETDALDPADYKVEGHLASLLRSYTRENRPERRRDFSSGGSRPRSGRHFPTPEIWSSEACGAAMKGPRNDRISIVSFS